MLEISCEREERYPDTSGQQSRRRKRKRNRNFPVEDNSEPERTFRPYNYFIGFRVDNPQLVENLRRVQEAVVENAPQLQRAMISPATFHITLAVLKLATEDDVKTATEALSGCDLTTDIPLEVPFASLGHFDNEVLFAKPAPGDSLDQIYVLRRKLVNIYSAYDEFEVVDRKEYHPHLTLFKLIPKKFRCEVKKILPEWYEEHKLNVFGTQRVDDVKLLAMMKPKAVCGFYHSVASFQLLVRECQAFSLEYEEEFGIY
ncbi:unnamed protein product [Notodromas monacha]|uniref:A-kinase anchor protein 7-like phosphoesterase domain-containing protein n=1 Tax=Notodromas monacha TaxID=399045 RepID=A0A7R9BTA8_9CRUS|nr:unnamed protein product [Notodromas monacha]CAG0921011.1 unnamed protein product [Notodromas monacha]